MSLPLLELWNFYSRMLCPETHNQQVVSQMTYCLSYTSMATTFNSSTTFPVFVDFNSSNRLKVFDHCTIWRFSYCNRGSAHLWQIPAHLEEGSAHLKESHVTEKRFLIYKWSWAIMMYISVSFLILWITQTQIETIILKPFLNIFFSIFRNKTKQNNNNPFTYSFLTQPNPNVNNCWILDWKSGWNIFYNSAW